MLKKLFLLVATLLLAVGMAAADPIAYLVTVDTSSIAGTAGSLDFQFNPGPLASQAASVQVLDFNSDGTLASSPILTGNVSGTLASTVTFTNSTVYNDYFSGFLFGGTLSFVVSLLGPALTTPDGTSTSGSAFAFSMFSDADGTIPALTSDAINGFAYTVAVNLDGTTTPTVSSSKLTASVTTVPEPSSAWLFGAGLLGLGILQFKRSRARALHT